MEDHERNPRVRRGGKEMERLVVTKDLAIRAILYGACKVPKVGAPAREFSTADLIWAERIFEPKELKAFELPLWVLSGSGDGSGSWYGSGYGKDLGAKILAVD